MQSYKNVYFSCGQRKVQMISDGNSLAQRTISGQSGLRNKILSEVTLETSEVTLETSVVTLETSLAKLQNVIFN